MFLRERKLQIESIHEENDRLILLELFIVVRACLWGALQIDGGGLGRKNKKRIKYYIIRVDVVCIWIMTI